MIYTKNNDEFLKDLFSIPFNILNNENIFDIYMNYKNDSSNFKVYFYKQSENILKSGIINYFYSLETQKAIPIIENYNRRKKLSYVSILYLIILFNNIYHFIYIEEANINLNDLFL